MRSPKSALINFPGFRRETSRSLDARKASRHCQRDHRQRGRRRRSRTRGRVKRVCLRRPHAAVNGTNEDGGRYIGEATTIIVCYCAAVNLPDAASAAAALSRRRHTPKHISHRVANSFTSPVQRTPANFLFSPVTSCVVRAVECTLSLQMRIILLVYHY